MKLLRTIAALSAVLTPLMAEVAMSRPMPGATDFPRASNPRVNVPVCFIETTSGTTFDLVSLCGSNAAPPAPRNAPPPPPGTNPTNAPNAGNPAAAPNPNVVTRDAAGNPTTTPAGTANPGNPTVGNPGTSPTATPNNPNNLNPEAAPNTTPNNPNNPNNLNPGAAPYTAPNNLTPPSGTAGDGSGGVAPNPTINLPRVPPSSFGPGGVAPTRDAIDGPRN
jgi:hypothetical protein